MVLGTDRELVWQGVRAGMHLRVAAASVGVSYDAARGWVRDCGGVVPPPSRAGRSGTCYRRLSATDRDTIGLMLAAKRTLTRSLPSWAWTSPRSAVNAVVTRPTRASIGRCTLRPGPRRPH